MKNNKHSRVLNIVVPHRLDITPETRESNLLKSRDPNLFKTQTPQKLKVIKLEPERSFEYVGVKALRSYYDRMKRGTSKRMSTITRVSSISKQKDENRLISQGQLLNLKQNMNSSNGSNSFVPYQSFPNSPKCNESSLYHSRSFFQNSNSSFSVKKMKHCHKIYEEFWQQNEQRCLQTMKGFPSLLKLATESRQKIQEKEVNYFKYIKNHMSTQMWESALRQNFDVNKVNNQVNKMKVKKNLLSLVGRQKMLQETDWVKRKGEEGYRFKLLAKNQEE